MQLWEGRKETVYLVPGTWLMMITIYDSLFTMFLGHCRFPDASLHPLGHRGANMAPLLPELVLVLWRSLKFYKGLVGSGRRRCDEARLLCLSFHQTTKCKAAPTGSTSAARTRWLTPRWPSLATSMNHAIERSIGE